MAESYSLARFSGPLLFLKATKKKQVFIPTYTRHDGVVVPGHYAMVHVADDHSHDKVLSGEGSHSQKQAHAKLKLHPWFNELPSDHQAHVLLEHATELQDKASAAAVLSTFRKKILAGQSPSPAEWKGYAGASKDKQAALAAEFASAGKAEAFSSGLVAYQAKNPPTSVPAPVTPESFEPPKPKAPIPEPSPAPEPTSPSASKTHVDAINAAKLPSSNTNAASVNAKLDAIAKATEAGDVKTLLMMGYGSNNYGVKAAKLANQSLELLGSKEKVIPGQKFGQHAGLKASTEAASTPTPDAAEAKPMKVVGAKKPAPEKAAPVADAAMGGWEVSKGDAAFNGTDVLVYQDAVLGKTYFVTKGEDGGIGLYSMNEKGDMDGPELFDSGSDLAEVLQEVHEVTIPPAALSKLGIEGPKDGDLKDGADGTLIFSNGRWHKLDSASQTTPSATPAFIGHGYENTTEGHNKFWNIALYGNEVHTHYGKIGTKGSTTVKKYYDNTSAAVAMLKQMKQKKAKGYVPKGNVSMPVKPTSMPVAPVAAPKVVSATQAVPKTAAQMIAPESIDDWNKTGGQQGYNEGGTYVDPQGVAWYCKFPAGGEKVAKNELVASKLYALAGVNVPDVKLISQGGKVGIASKLIDGAKQDKAALLAGTAPGLLSGFAVDAWLANWDAVGNNPAKGFDNILIQSDGDAVRIDAGGALLYGGAGGKKQVFTDKVIELKTMLDANTNAHTAAVFGKMAPSDIAASVAKVAAIPDDAIEAYALMYGPGDMSQRKRLAATLIARKADMVAQYPQAAKKAKAAATKSKQQKPDPRALKVDPSMLPKPHEFLNWNGTGKPISDKPYVQQNVVDEKAIFDFALKGNLVALKAYKFQPVDKTTGKPVGQPLSMDKHPSNYVRDFYDNCVSFLDVIANPPEQMRSFGSKAASTIEQLSSLFKPFDYGMSVGKAPANQRLGFWIALGAVKTPTKFKPKTNPALSDVAKQAAYAAFKKLPNTVRTFIKAVQSTGSNNQPYRDGKDSDNQGQDTRTVLTDLYAHAVSHAEGTTINKWMEMPDSMVNQFMSEPEGLVFQNPGSMCTSYKASATSGFGKHRVVIHYGKGASAIDTFGSGGFAGEAEITTLPGARFMVLSRKMVPDVEHGKPGSTRLELEVLMLPPDPTYVSNLKKTN